MTAATYTVDTENVVRCEGTPVGRIYAGEPWPLGFAASAISRHLMPEGVFLGHHRTHAEALAAVAAVDRWQR